ncbi:MAG TPA: hypothetical protein VHA56_16160 [Mucilaginibacter sp.]|nr:hypothetical protein [Mucilaginibacter sp.]
MAKLKEEVARKYEVLAGHGVGEYRFAGQTVHLDKLTLEQADKLVKKGFPYLVKKAPAKPAQEPPQKEDKKA